MGGLDQAFFEIVAIKLTSAVNESGETQHIKQQNSKGEHRRTFSAAGEARYLPHYGVFLWHVFGFARAHFDFGCGGVGRRRQFDEHVRGHQIVSKQRFDTECIVNTRLCNLLQSSTLFCTI